jgi:hypothetical protein
MFFPLDGKDLQDLPKAPVLKSALLPGWGEHAFDKRSRGYVFNGIEAALWVFAGVAYGTAVSHENDLFFFATEYGQISDPQDKSDIFLDRVSKYDSMDEYNAQMLRNRQWDRIYSAENGQFWEWQSTEKRGEYFDLKTQRYRWRQRVTYAFGAIALNHLVSTMDALYLKRSHLTLHVQPQVGESNAGLQLQIRF